MGSQYIKIIIMRNSHCEGKKNENMGWFPVSLC